MEPCKAPSMTAKPAHTCGCAQAADPARVPVHSLETIPDRKPAFSDDIASLAPTTGGVPLALPLLAAAFSAFVFARQRGPSRIVGLYLARPGDRQVRRRFTLPRLVLSARERAAVAVLYQIWHWSLRTIGSPGLQAKAFANSGSVEGGPIARNSARGWGFVFSRSFARSGRMLAAQTRAHARNSR